MVNESLSIISLESSLFTVYMCVKTTAGTRVNMIMLWAYFDLHFCYFCYILVKDHMYGCSVK